MENIYTKNDVKGAIFYFSERPASPIPDRWRDGCQRSEAEPASGVTAGRD
jgi:hypothetical protein